MVFICCPSILYSFLALVTKAMNYPTAMNQDVRWRLRRVWEPLLLWLVLAVGLPNSLYGHPIDMKALAQIESSNNPKAYNEKSQARGLYQLTPIVLKQYDMKWPEKDQIGVNGWIKEIKADPYRQTIIANWYLNWLYDRCWTIKDTLIAWNWGIGNWRMWRTRSWSNYHGEEFFEAQLPKETKNFLKKYEELTKENL